MNDHELRTRVKALLHSQLYGVLATQGEGGAPHASIIAFSSADDLSAIVFATPRTTRKYAYMMARDRITFFIDDRRPRKEEIMDASGLEAQGRVRELLGQERDDYRAMFLARRPDMASFVDAPGSALMRLEVERYDMVDHFQHVLVLNIGGHTDYTGDKS
ncbi:MAG: pyridoxamine 5'-phosphate oxidase family protein [Spirochaetia bacterium]|nr:pyridoxamine 5'-phosphate oxidase family protein [Spirochaetia bacterium]